jgi:BRCT domain type II-containing protein
VDISLALRRQNGSSDGEIHQTCGIIPRGADNPMRGLVLVFSADVSAAWGA